MDIFQSKDGVELALLMAEWGEGTALEMACSLKVCGGKEHGHVSSRRGARPETWLQRAAWTGFSCWSVIIGREIIGDWPPRISE